MGQTSAATIQGPHFELESWIEAIQDTSTTRFNEVNPYRSKLFLNKHIVDIVESYELQFKDKDEFITFINSYSARLYEAKERNQPQLIKNCPFIYHVRYFKDFSSKEMCSNSYKGLLFIDKVDLRLKEVNDIPFQDQVYLFKACLQGFKLLYQKYGIFQIREEMIFFTDKGKVKVWIHPNLSKFCPNYEPEFYNTTEYQTKGTQAEMIKGLINVIEHNSDCSNSSGSFKQYLIKQNVLNKLTFKKAIQYFEAYLDEQNLELGSYMSSIYLLFNSEEDCILQKSQVVANKIHENRPSSNLFGRVHNYPFQTYEAEKLPEIVERSCDKQKSSKYSCREEVLKSGSIQQHLANKIHKQYESFAPASGNLNDLALHKRTQSYENAPEERFPLPPTTIMKSPPFESKVLNIQKGIPIPEYPLQKQPDQYFQRRIPHGAVKIDTLQSLHQSKQTLIQNLKTPRNQNILQPFRSEIKTQSLGSTNTKHSISKKVNYYSETKEFSIDQEIAQDLVNYLNIDPKEL